MNIVPNCPSLSATANSGDRVLNSVRYRGDNLQGLRIVVGATLDVAISNMLRSQPFVLVRHEGKATPTRTPPTWTNLSPSWESAQLKTTQKLIDIITINEILGGKMQRLLDMFR
ncbi:Hypothetical protein PHPALM_8384 [Phytophthora palmivora]|uniref:Uncharacterized protein n=1 Tax=Phytophthora palmivora TaxID=4796 RepID=A0A2P4Y9Z6_9STRA|nr:Hypothetical protein PHPALM_8384 [Phytophthora palmivora]